MARYPAMLGRNAAKRRCAAGTAVRGSDPLVPGTSYFEIGVFVGRLSLCNGRFSALFIEAPYTNQGRQMRTRYVSKSPQHAKVQAIVIHTQQKQQDRRSSARDN